MFEPAGHVHIRRPPSLAALCPWREAGTKAAWRAGGLWWRSFPNTSAKGAKDGQRLVSRAAGNGWFKVIIIFHHEYLEMAQKFILVLIQDLDRNLSRLTASFEKAVAEKVRCQEEVNQTNKTIELANKLVKELEASSPFLPRFYLKYADRLFWILSLFVVGNN